MSVRVSRAFQCTVDLGLIKKEQWALEKINSSGGILVKVEKTGTPTRTVHTYEFDDKSKLIFKPSTPLWSFEIKYLCQ
jgi:hypothetical protein